MLFFLFRSNAYSRFISNFCRQNKKCCANYKLVNCKKNLMETCDMIKKTLYVKLLPKRKYNSISNNQLVTINK